MSRFFYCIPQVGCFRVGVFVFPEIMTDAFLKGVGAEVLLQHAQDGRAFLIGQNIEHAGGFVRVFDRELDGAGAVQSVHLKRRGPRDGKTGPAPPFGFPSIYGHHFHESGKRLVEPQAVPPAHSHQIAKPHMRVFMRDNICNAFQLTPGSRIFIDEQSGFTKRNGS